MRIQDIRSKPNPFSRHYQRGVRQRAVSDWDLCPVSEIAGVPHFFRVEDGVLINWNVMGDSRSHIFVCSECAVHAT